MGSVQQPCNASKLHSCVEISQPAPLPTTTTTKKKKKKHKMQTRGAFAEGAHVILRACEMMFHYWNATRR